MGIQHESQLYWVFWVVTLKPGKKIRKEIYVSEPVFRRLMMKNVFFCRETYYFSDLIINKINTNDTLTTFSYEHCTPYCEEQVDNHLAWHQMLHQDLLSSQRFFSLCWECLFAMFPCLLVGLCHLNGKITFHWYECTAKMI